VSQPHLWPPLEIVEAAVDGNHAIAQDADASQTLPGLEWASQGIGSAEANSQAAHLLLPLTELVQRRTAVQVRHFSAVWQPGCLVQITANGSVMGVLLDHLVQGSQWAGWLAASETSWASAFDVLLEPEDDPFEPLFGVIQTWNPVSLEPSDKIQTQIVGEVSASRLAAIRAVAQECVDGQPVNVPSEPGRIALRLVGGTFMVLTGTPLGSNDIRRQYQSVYHAVSARLIANQFTQRISHLQKMSPSKGGDRF
jgi:hypothetical protein